VEVAVGLEPTKTGFAGQRLDRFGIAALNFENPVGMIERRGDTRGNCELDERELLHAMINSSRIPQPSTPPLRLSAP
jgi:hypothetical protein